MADFDTFKSLQKKQKAYSYVLSLAERLAYTRGD